jgi:hypothetical protein
VIFVSRAKILRFDFTIHAHKMADEQTIFVYRLTIPLTDLSMCSPLSTQQTMQDSEMEEAVRQAD